MVTETKEEIVNNEHIENNIEDKNSEIIINGETVLIDPIEEMFEKTVNNDSDVSLELFKDDGTGDIALKTELTNNEHVLVTALITEDEMIQDDLNLEYSIYGNFLNHFRRHKLSLNRKSRAEFTEINKTPTSADLLNETNSVKNLAENRK